MPSNGSHNPFTYREPISDPDRFFGRQREVEQVFSRLRNREAESSSIVGERRIGKTSLLRYLAHPQVRRRFGLDAPQYVFLYTDLRGLDATATPDRLVRGVMSQLALQIPDEGVKAAVDELRGAEIIDNFALAGLFDVIDLQGLHVVLLLDEFERVTANPNFGADFFYGLRSLATQNNLTLVTSSRNELIELTHSEVIKSSPFFNIFANINVRLFQEAEARQLISISLEGTGVGFSEPEIELLFRLAGFHPFFLQAACHFLFAAYQQGLDGPGRAGFLHKEFQREAFPHLGEYWFSSPDGEKIVLAALALLEHDRRAAEKPSEGGEGFSGEQLRDLYRRSGGALAQLGKRGLLVEEAGGYRLFNTSFGPWILSELSGRRAEQGEAVGLRLPSSAPEKPGTRARVELDKILPMVSPRYHPLLTVWASDPQTWATLSGLLNTGLP